MQYEWVEVYEPPGSGRYVVGVEGVKSIRQLYKGEGGVAIDYDNLSTVIIKPRFVMSCGYRRKEDE